MACKRWFGAGWFQKPIAVNRMWQLVEISQQSLYSRINQLFDRSAVGCAAAVDKAWHLIERTTVARAHENRTHGFVRCTHRKQDFEQIQQYVLFTGVNRPGFVGGSNS